MTSSHRRGPFRPALFVALLVLTTFAACAAEEVAPLTEVLAPGEPALTREGVGRFTNFLEWMIDVPFTPAQRDLLQQGLVES